MKGSGNQEAADHLACLDEGTWGISWSTEENAE